MEGSAAMAQGSNANSLWRVAVPWLYGTSRAPYCALQSSLLGRCNLPQCHNRLGIGLPPSPTPDLHAPTLARLGRRNIQSQPIVHAADQARHPVYDSHCAPGGFHLPCSVPGAPSFHSACFALMRQASHADFLPRPETIAWPKRAEITTSHVLGKCSRAMAPFAQMPL